MTTKIFAVVDDDAAVRDATENLARSMGFSTRTFGSAEAYLAAPDIDLIDCLVTDVQMDGMNGIELTRRLQEAGLRTHVIVITAFPDDRIRQQAMAAGAYCFLSKPFEGQALMECIELALG